MRTEYTLSRTAPMTYRVRLRGTGEMVGWLKRGRATGPRGGSVPVWNGWVFTPGGFTQAVEEYPGSQGVAAGTMVRFYRTAGWATS